MIYETFKKNIINKFKIKRDLIVSQNKFKNDNYNYLLQIDDDLKLYESIISTFMRIFEYNILDLVETLCKKHDLEFVSPNPHEFFDFSINLDEKILIHFFSTPTHLNSTSIKNFAQKINNCETSTMIIFLIKNTVDSKKATEKFLNRVKNYTNNINIKCLTFEEFLSDIFGEEELIDFQYSMSTFKEEIQTEIGYQITEIFTAETLTKFKEKLEKTIVEFDYDSIRSNAETKKFITDFNYNHIKNLFKDNEKYKILLGNRDFAESLITSEWLYDNYNISEHLDNTFIVAGYLKSIEQLLWDILLIIANDREINDYQINKSNENIINNTLGSLNHFLNNWDNEDLFENAFGNSTKYVMGYINEIISKWRKLRRNGYFHKDNLNEPNKIDLIRNETFFIYMLIIGSLEISENDLKKLTL